MSADTKIRVLIVGPDKPLVGGQSIQAELLTEGLKDVDEIDVSFLAVNPVFLPFLQKIKYVRTVLTSFRYLIGLLVNVPKHDVIHIYSASFSSFLLAPAPAIAVAKLFRKKTLLNYHSGYLEEHLANWPKTALPLIRRCDKVVAPSDYLVDVFSEFGIKAEAILNIVPTEAFKFRFRNELQPKFLSNRNFEDLYDVECTLRAFAEIQRVYPEASLVVAGEGPKREELQRLTEKMELDNVVFVGQVSHSEMAACYDRTDIYLNSPRVDNMPVSILEAFASGAAVVSTNAGGIPYIVEHERNGLLVEVGDHAQLAREAMRLLKDKELSKHIIDGAKADLRKYSWEFVRSDWINAYKS